MPYPYSSESPAEDSNSEREFIRKTLKKLVHYSLTVKGSKEYLTHYQLSAYGSLKGE